MPTDIDGLPLYDRIMNNSGYLSNIWCSSLSTLIDTLTGYLSQNGIFLPNLTTIQRNQIQNPQNGQLIYNTTVDAPQFYQISSASWRTISFT